MFWCSVFDVSTGENLATLKSHSEKISGCCLDASRLELMTTSHDGSTHVWDLRTIASRLQRPAYVPRVLDESQCTSGSVRAHRVPESLPLQDLQNVIAGRHDDETELAPLPLQLFSPQQARMIAGKCSADAIASSVPLLPEAMHNHLESQASLGGDSADSSCVENENYTALPIRLSRAQLDSASWQRLQGSSKSALRHSIAGDPSAELRREALQRQRDHKLWESSHMPLWEELRTELESVRMVHLSACILHLPLASGTTSI